MERINLLFTLDEAYLDPLRAMLKSLFVNKEHIAIYLIHDDIKGNELEALDDYCTHHGASLNPIQAPQQLFEGAPVCRRLTRSMYYRLMVYRLLPHNIDRILYLDPDILVLGPIRELYETALAG